MPIMFKIVQSLVLVAVIALVVTACGHGRAMVDAMAENHRQAKQCSLCSKDCHKHGRLNDR